MNSYFSPEECRLLGLRSVGDNVLISRKASIYGASEISIGHDVRIDDFCILSGSITIGRYVHIASYTGLFGSQAGIEIEDFAGLSSRVTIYAATDDYSGETLTNPTVPDAFKRIKSAKVKIGRHVIIGSGTVILPGVSLGEGCSIGALSLVTRDIPEWTISAGIPAKPIKSRSRNLLELEKELIKKVGER